MNRVAKRCRLPVSIAQRIRSGAARLVLAGALMATGSTVAAETGPVVQTAKGGVRGALAEGVTRFLGLPYAAAPVGPLRWRPPSDVRAWKGVRSAESFGPACAQGTTLGVFAGPTNDNEDCLYLNVYTSTRDARTGGKLPVMIWLHGGGWVNGTGSDYDPTWLAQAGVVVVTINYRMNLFGVLAHPALDREGHHFANYGLLDQQAAFRWVRDNIAQFGGDPSRVTIAGQSGGGSSVGLHLISPLAAGLFHRGIIESGRSYWHPTPLADAEEKGTAFAVAAGCGSGADAATAACLRRLPASAISKLAAPPAGAPSFTIVSAIDGTIVPFDGATAFSTNRFNHVPVMNGSTLDEGNFFLAVQQYESRAADKTITDADLRTFVDGTFTGQGRDDLLRAYPASDYPNVQMRLSAIRTDSFVCPIQRGSHAWAGKTPVYAYEFQDRTAPPYFPTAPGLMSLAEHTLDLPYLFRGFHGGDKGVRSQLNGSQRQLSQLMVAAWANFARTGNPNGTGNAPWPAFTKDPSAPSYVAQTLDGFKTFSDADFTKRHKCAFWNAITP